MSIDPVAVTSPLDRVLALCESDDERAKVHRFCNEMNIDTHGAELNFAALFLFLDSIVRARGQFQRPVTPIVVSVHEPRPRAVPVTRSRLPQVKRASFDSKYALTGGFVVAAMICGIGLHDIVPTLLALAFAGLTVCMHFWSTQ